jgi:hypothetical protein
LEASHALTLQPVMLAHLRFDLTPSDPMIALEKALKRSLARGLGGHGLVALSDAETAFMSRVSGLSMEPPARRHKDMIASDDKKSRSRARKAGDGSDSGSSSSSDSDDDTKSQREPVFKVRLFAWIEAGVPNACAHSRGLYPQTPVGQAAVALMFRSLEWTPQLWLCWDADVMSYAILHCVAAYSSAFSDGTRRPWFKLGVEPRVDVVKFGPTIAQLHDAVHDLLAPPPVFLRPEMSGACVCGRFAAPLSLCVGIPPGLQVIPCVYPQIFCRILSKLQRRCGRSWSGSDSVFQRPQSRCIPSNVAFTSRLRSP